MSSLTASMPLKTNGAKELTTGAIDVSSAEITGTLAVGNGGTGTTTLAANGVMIGNGTSPVNVTSAGTTGQVLMSNGVGLDPTFQAPILAVYTGISITNQNQNRTNYYYATGYDHNNALEDNMTTVVPRDCRVTRLTVLPTSAPSGAGQSFTFSVHNHTRGGVLTVSMPTGTPIGPISATGSLTCLAGDEISLQIVTSATSGPLTGAKWAIEISAP